MKQKLLNLKRLRGLMLLAVMCIFGAGTAWGDEVTFSYEDYKGQGTSGTGSEYTMEKTDVSITNTKFYCGTSYNNAQFYANGTTTITPLNGVTITQVVLTAANTSYNGYQSGGTYTASVGSVSGSTTSTTITWSGSATELFTISNNKQIRWTSIVVTYTTSGGTPSCSVPTFTPAAGTYSQAQSVTISCATDGATIYYTTDGSTPDNTSTEYSGAIAVSSTTTIKAIATADAYNNSSIASATYTITNPSTIAEVRNQGTGTVFTKGVVTSCVGTTGYIQDATAAICVYGSSLTVGDEITVSGTLSTYKGLLEITTPVVTVLSSNNTVTPTVKTIAEIKGDDYTSSTSIQGLYITIEDATVTTIDGSNTTIAQGDNTIVVRGISDVEYAVNDILTLNGNIGCFDGAQIANPKNVSVQQSTNPVINAEATLNLAYDATSGEIAYSIDHSVEETALSATLQEGIDWIADITVGDESVTFTTTANEGNADRTATITLSYEGAEDVTVTVTQKHYVADFATLPFEFDGGKADIENTDGLTQSGLGGDYGSSPKLKFDGTGDNIVLKINERPGVLTFDVKGNSFSGGTFTVQTSEDGIEYTDVATYSTLGDTETKTISNLGEDVRYIKWIYTDKSSGNVALGNIALAQYVEPQSYTVSWTEGENIDDIFVFAGDESEAIENGSSVDEGTTVMVSVDVAEGYELEALTVKDAEENDISLTEIEAGVYYSFEMPASNVTITATAKEYVAPATTSYALATSISPGKRYIIASSADDGAAYAMGEQKNNNRGAGSITIADGVATVASDAGVYEFIIASTEDGYTIYDESYQSTGGYLYAASSSSNNLKTETELDENGNGIWSIDIEEGVATVVAQGTNTRNVMQYNSGSSLFSCYASATQSPVYLFEKVEDSETIPVTIGASGYATLYYSDKTLEIPENVSASIVTSVDKGNITFEEFASVIPAGTGVVLQGAPGSYDFVVTEGAEAPTSNMLSGSDVAATTVGEGDCKFYQLSLNAAGTEGSIGFYWGAADGGAFTNGAHKAYLVVPAEQAKAMGYSFNGIVTGIRSIGAEVENGEIYTIGGVRMKGDKLPKGIYIVNGKKMVVK